MGIEGRKQKGRGWIDVSQPQEYTGIVLVVRTRTYISDDEHLQDDLSNVLFVGSVWYDLYDLYDLHKTVLLDQESSSVPVPHVKGFERLGMSILSLPLLPCRNTALDLGLPRSVP